MSNARPAQPEVNDSAGLLRFAARIEYNGTGFSGWQAQKHNVRTVQSELEHALSRVADHPVSVITAGRTDTGVHATHQVVHFDSSARRSSRAWVMGSNRFLPSDIRVHWVTSVENAFHARFSALSRSYRFIVLNRPVASSVLAGLVTPEFRPLSLPKMQAAAALLRGEHDFSSFRAAGCQAHSPVRTVSSIALTRVDDFIFLDITANAFLQHMVRNIAGSLIEVGYGKRDLNWFSEVLDARDRTLAGVTAVGDGLYLTGVLYPEEFGLPSRSSTVTYWGT